MSRLLGRFGGALARHPRRSLAVILATLLGVFAVSSWLGGNYSDATTVPGTDAQRAADLLTKRFPATSGDDATVVFHRADGTLTAPATRASIREAVARIAGDAKVTEVVGPFVDGQTSQDGRTAFATVRYSGPAAEIDSPAAADRLERATDPVADTGVEVSFRGPVVDAASETSVPIGEIVGVAVAALVLILLFRSTLSMVLTLLTAGITVAMGLAFVKLLAGAFDVPSLTSQLGIMLGLGAGIDYALFLTSRARQHLAEGDSAPRAIGRAMATSGVAVLAGAAIVVVAICGLAVTGIPIAIWMGIGGAIVVVCVAIGAVTILPTGLAMIARRLTPRPGARSSEGGAGFARWARGVQRHPIRALAAGAIILGVLAVPVADLRLGQPDDGTKPATATQRVAYDRLTDAFGPGFNGPLIVAVDLADRGSATAELAALERAVAADPNVAAVVPAQLNPARDTALITVLPRTAPADRSTNDLVDRLRETTIPTAIADSGVRAYVGGATAAFQDLDNRVSERLPLVIGIVLVLSLILLMAVFRSVLVPLASAAMNLLSIGAAFGVIVAVFQWGWARQLIGLEGTIPIVSFVPMLVFAVLFGLSMDYFVFMLSRIREAHRDGMGAGEAIVSGMAVTSRIITAAGIIMIAVFLGFVTDPDPTVKLFGLSLGLAVLFDITAIRLLVLPATLFLLGERAWWFPAWLDRILPNVNIEGSDAHGDRTPRTLEPAPGSAGGR